MNELLTHGREPVALSAEEQATLHRMEEGIARVMNGSASPHLKLVFPDGEEMELTRSLYQALQQLVHYLAQDQAVMIRPYRQ